MVRCQLRPCSVGADARFILCLASLFFSTDIGELPLLFLQWGPPDLLTSCMLQGFTHPVSNVQKFLELNSLRYSVSYCWWFRDTCSYRLCSRQQWTMQLNMFFSFFTKHPRLRIVLIQQNSWLLINDNINNLFTNLLKSIRLYLFYCFIGGRIIDPYCFVEAPDTGVCPICSSVCVSVSVQRYIAQIKFIPTTFIILPCHRHNVVNVWSRYVYDFIFIYALQITMQKLYS